MARSKACWDGLGRAGCGVFSVTTSRRDHIRALTYRKKVISSRNQGDWGSRMLFRGTIYSCGIIMDRKVSGKMCNLEQDMICSSPYPLCIYQVCANSGPCVIPAGPASPPCITAKGLSQQES